MALRNQGGRAPDQVLAARHHAQPAMSMEEAILRRGIMRQVPIFLPDDNPIPEAVEFNPSGSVSTAVVQTNIAIPLVPQVGQDAGFVTLPQNTIGRIAGFIISITNMTALTNVTFTLTINGGPVAGYSGLSLTPRVSPYTDAQFSEPGCRILVPNGAKIGVTFSNFDGGTYVVGAAVSGWYWPEASGKRWVKLGY